ncbi:MAG: molecular chaperone TorD family protein [Candidatus Thiodiazotropha sp.]
MGRCFREIGCEELRIDYTRLFLGPFNIRSKPYGSVYLDRGNVVMGATTMAVLALYREGGFHGRRGVHRDARPCGCGIGIPLSVKRAPGRRPY